MTSLLLIGALVYFIPSLVAWRRDQQFGAVLAVNLLLGWTVIGWVVALAIALWDGGDRRAARQRIAAYKARQASGDDKWWEEGLPPA